MRATRTVVTPGRSNRVVGRIDSCLSGVIPPVEGKRTVRESVWEIPGPCTPVCTPPHVPRTFAFRTRPRFRISGDEISRPRSSAARVGRAFLSVPSVSARTPRRRGTARAGPRESAAHARASAFALQEREALARLVKGCAWAGLDPADPRSSRAGHVVAALSAVSGRASRLLLTATGAHPSPTSRDGEG